ncbi:MAG: hypothetical protein ACE5FU_03790, partial [Nitrospinota bacterium]
MYIRGVPAFFSASRAVTSAFLVISLFVGCASTEKIDITREREKVKAEKNKAIIVAKVGDVEITKERVELYAKFLAPKIIPHGDIRQERMNRIKVQ